MPNFNKDYYSILGIPRTSSAEEIKAVFRKLAMIHHPDKNPLSSGEEFTKILEAYEILSDPESKKKYDLKFAAAQIKKGTRNAQKTTNNSDRYSEAELKRRQYYQEHYKSQPRYKKANVVKSKNRVYESRIILFSIPLAIVLLIFIVNIYGKNTSDKNELSTRVTEIDTALVNSMLETKNTLHKDFVYEPANKAAPYADWFGNNKFDSIPSENLVIRNALENDLIFCLLNQSTHQVDCHFLLKSGSDISIERMIKGTYLLEGYTGKKFNPDKVLKAKKAIGGFEEQEIYFALNKNLIHIEKKKSETLSVTVSKSAILRNKITAQDFFLEPKS